MKWLAKYYWPFVLKLFIFKRLGSTRLYTWKSASCTGFRFSLTYMLQSSNILLLI